MGEIDVSPILLQEKERTVVMDISGNIKVINDCLGENGLFTEKDLIASDFHEYEGVLFRCTEDGEQQLCSFEVPDLGELYEDWKHHDNVLVVCLGLSDLSYIEGILHYMSSDSKLVIYEPEMGILSHMVRSYDLTSVLIPGRSALMWEEPEKDLQSAFCRRLVSLNWHKLCYNIRLVGNPSYYPYISKVKRLISRMSEIFLSAYLAMGNSLEDVLQGFQQNAENLLACMKTNSALELLDKFEGYPAIVISAGPSLEKNISCLKQAEGKAVVLALDASYNACMAQGVSPDAVVTLERGVETYDYYFKDKTFREDDVLFSPSLVWKDTLSEFPGKEVIIARNDDGVDGWWNRFFPNVTHFATGASSATFACVAAKMMGCNPVILIGQDLAFTGGKKHADIAHTEAEGDNDDAEKEEGLFVEGIDGEMLPTDGAYNLFRWFFEAFAEIFADSWELVDATEGGAKIRGSKIMSFQEAIDTYCTRELPYHIHDLLSDVTVSEQEVYDKCREIDRAVNRNLRALYKIRKKSEKHYRTLEKILERLESDTTEEELARMVVRMQEGNRIISFIMSQRDIVSFFQQYIMQTVTHVKALGNELTPLNVLQNIKLQGNLMGAVKRVCRLLETEYEKLRSSLRKEIEKLDMDQVDTSKWEDTGSKKKKRARRNRKQVVSEDMV